MPRCWAELALDDDQRHALARQFDGVGVPQLVRREAPSDAGLDGGVCAGRLVRRLSTTGGRVSAR
jgi:hypothetical protein